MTCARCESPNVTSRETSHTFQYGDVELHCSVPVHTCVDCSLEFVDHVGELIQDNAIQRHMAKTMKHERDEARAIAVEALERIDGSAVGETLRSELQRRTTPW
jgi:hypothetical protein